jgi:TMEM175 potassium channel family protein
MGKARLEAFSDGVIAVIITIMVLELKAPHGTDLQALVPLAPTFLAYVLSFVVVAIYWNNHHHLMHAVQHVTGGILWTNTHLLFWLSLVPFTTAWMSDNRFASLPTAVYGANLLLAGFAYTLLVQCLMVTEGGQSQIARSLGRDLKGKASIAIYAVAIPLAFVSGWIACALYALVAALWFVPDRRIERR